MSGHTGTYKLPVSSESQLVLVVGVWGNGNRGSGETVLVWDIRIHRYLKEVRPTETTRLHILV